jgi:hypothetical protein
MLRLLKEIEEHSRNLPDDIQQEVLDFIKFKEQKMQENKEVEIEISLLSQKSLSQWESEEEDEAWKSYQ